MTSIVVMWATNKVRHRELRKLRLAIFNFS